MLKQRIITALLLLAILLPAVFYPAPDPFRVVALVLIAAGAWEWGTLNQCSSRAALALGALCALMCVASWYVGLIAMNLVPLWAFAGAAWVLLGAWLLHGGVSTWSSAPRAIRLTGGIFALWVAWLAVVQARGIGMGFLFSTLMLVWVADVFAYIAGRTLGGRFFNQKLAPTISPGKTWEGAVGGALGVLACAFIWRAWDASGQSPDSLYAKLSAFGLAFMVIAVLFLSAMSVVGDLVESLIKRSAGAKDSSGLLPGHGGVLDRVDALLPVLPLAMMFASL